MAQTKDKDRGKSKDKAKKALVLAFKKGTAKQRSEAATVLASNRWSKPEWKDPKARSKFATMVSKLGEGSNRGRPRQLYDRCPCGEMTAKRARARRHRCKAA